MRAAALRRVSMAAVAALLAVAGAAVEGRAAAPADKGKGKGAAPMLPGAGSKEPVNIDANKLDYYDKEQKLVYTGDVVAVQGDSTLKASVLTIFLQKDPQAQGAAPPAGGAAPAAGGSSAAVGPGAGSSVRHMDAEGPVTLISKDQIGTGAHATYDKAENKVTLTGNVTLSQGTNVTQGDRLVYDMTTGQAQVFSGNTSGRVKSVFTPGSGAPGGDKPGAKSAPAPEAKPKAGTPHRAGKPVAAGGATAQQ